MKKLFVIVDSNLSKSQQWVQGTHAVAQYLIDNPNSEWKNETLVMLKTKTLEDLYTHLTEVWNLNISKFHEPYYGNRLTAIAGYNIEHTGHIRELELI